MNQEELWMLELNVNLKKLQYQAHSLLIFEM